MSWYKCIYASIQQENVFTIPTCVQILVVHYMLRLLIHVLEKGVVCFSIFFNIFQT